MKPPSQKDLDRTHGAELIAVGLLVSLSCGLCSGCVVISSLDPHNNETVNYLTFVPFFGGIPILWGLYQIARGWLMRRGK